MANLRDWLPNLLAVRAMCLGVSKSPDTTENQEAVLQDYMIILLGSAQRKEVETQGSHFFPVRCLTTYFPRVGLYSASICDLIGLLWKPEMASGHFWCRHQIPRLHTTLQNYSNQNHVVITLKHTHRPMEQDGEPRINTHIYNQLVFDKGAKDTQRT